MKKVFYSDLDGTLICNERGTGLVPVACKNGKDTSFMLPETYSNFLSLTSKIKIVPVTTRCEESYKNIYLSSFFDDALVENGAILLCTDVMRSAKWLKDSRFLVRKEVKDFKKVEKLLSSYGYVNKRSHLEFAIDMVSKEGVTTERLSEIKDKLSEYSDIFLMNIEGNKAICTYKKLSKGENIKRHSKMCGYTPYVSAGDRLEDSSMFSQTKYSFGIHNIKANTQLEFCKEVLENVLAVV